MKVDSSIVFLYYRDLPRALAFYQDVLGLQLEVDQGWCKILRMTPTASVGLVDETRGSLKTAEDKPVMLTLVVEDVDAWYTKVKEAGADVIRPPQLMEEISVYGFFLRDPEGYTLEIQKFV